MPANRNAANGNKNKPPRAKKGHSPVSSKEDSKETRNVGPESAQNHVEKQGANEAMNRAEDTKFGDWRTGRNSAIIQQRDVDGDSTNGSKGKK